MTLLLAMCHIKTLNAILIVYPLTFFLLVFIIVLMQINDYTGFNSTTIYLLLLLIYIDRTESRICI